MSDAMREHIRELVRFARLTHPTTPTAIVAEAVKVERWLDATEPSPDTCPVRIAVDVGPRAPVPFGHLIALSLDDGTVPLMRGFERTIVLANVDVPEPPRETVGTAETNPTQGETL